MLKSIIRTLGSVSCCALLLAGCSMTLDDPALAGAVSFSAGSALLRDDATRGGILKTGTSFETNDTFVAWAWHSAAQQNLSFGTVTPVTLGAGGLWDYAPHQFWNWKGEGDYYDFLAIYPAGKPVTHPASTLAQPNVKATVTYDATSDQYDLMAAGYRRNDRTITTVPLTFNHMLSAVSIDVTNASGSMDNVGHPLTVTLKSCKFVHLQTSASVTVTFNGTTLDVQRPGNRSTTPVLGPTLSSGIAVPPGMSYMTERLSSWVQGNITWVSMDPDLDDDVEIHDMACQVYTEHLWGRDLSEIITWIENDSNTLLENETQISALAEQIHNAEEWDLMIPQNLNPSGELPPVLRVVFNKGGEDDVTEDLNLKDILSVDSNVPITEWRAGVKYHYQIELRIGVGIVVTVKTTPWEVVEAETPGLMI